MKNKHRFFGIIAASAVIIFSMTACPTDSGGTGTGAGVVPTSATYTSYDADGNSYTLVITNTANKAAYTPQSGDTVTLTVKNPAGTIIASCTGKVTSFSGGANVSFTNTKDGKTVQCRISGAAISGITGDIPRADGTGAISSPPVTPNKPATPGGGTPTTPNTPGGDTPTTPSTPDTDAGLSGSTYDAGETRGYILIFSGDTWTQKGRVGGEELNKGTYTVKNNIVTMIVTWSWRPEEEGQNPGAVWTGTLSADRKQLFLGSGPLTRL